MEIRVKDSLVLNIAENKTYYEISLRGFIDDYNTRELQYNLETFLAKKFKNTIFDLAEVNYISSTGFGCLISIIKFAKDNKFKVCFLHMNSKIKEVSKLLGFDKFMVIMNASKDAEEYFKE